MTKVHLPLAKYRDSQSDRIDPGRYTVRVEDADVQKSKAGNEMVVTWLKVTSGEFSGAVIVDRMTISEAAMFRIVGFLRAIKLPVPKRDIDIDTRTFVGRVLDVDVIDNEYRGSVSSQVSGYMVGSAPEKEESGADLSDLEEAAEADEAEEESAAEDQVEPDPEPEPEKPKAEKSEPDVIDLDDIQF